MKDFLTKHFLIEVFKLAFLRQSFAETVVEHLKYQYIPKELKVQKKVLKSFIDAFKTSQKIPTIGTISLLHKSDADVQQFLAEVQDCRVPDLVTIVEGLEDYIKTIRFQLLYEEVAEKHKKGETKDAIALSMEVSAEIHNFSLLRGRGGFVKIFGGYKDNIKEKQERTEEDMSDASIPTGIDPLDDITGGMAKNETALWILRSGVGKSTLLKYTGVHVARLGFNVLHIQAEGTKAEAFDKYTQVWTALDYKKVVEGNINKEDQEKLLGIAEKMIRQQKDIDLYAFEMFDEADMRQVKNLVLEYKKIYGVFPDLLLLDSLDLMHPGDGYRYGVDTQSIKMRLQNSAKKLKNLVTECGNMRAITVTQTGDIPLDVWNNPDKVITRSNSQGDRNIANSFSYVFTGNQTLDEYKNNTMRVYIDKLRHSKVINRIINIATAFSYGRFFDRKRTITLFME